MIEREHTLTFWRETDGGGGFGQDAASWTVLKAGVPATLEFLAGSIRRSAAGAEIDVSARAFVDPGDTDGIVLQPGDGVEITAGRSAGTPRYIIHQAAPVGEADAFFDDVYLLKDTDREFS